MMTQLIALGADHFMLIIYVFRFGKETVAYSDLVMLIFTILLITVGYMMVLWIFKVYWFDLKRSVLPLRRKL